jgi:MraZ protein
LGKYFCGLDNEYRFLAPDGFKKYLKDNVYITQGFDHNLWVLSDEAFQEIYKKLGNLNIADPLARLLFRLILGAATESGLTNQGYLKIPDDLREYAEIDSEVLLVGQGDYFEIWSPELWDKQEAELRNMEINTERFSTFEITTR